MTAHLHAPSDCEGEFCPIHNPSSHHMLDWTLVLRSMRRPPIYERLCPNHGIGHPDPDSAAWAERAVQENPGVWQYEISDGSYVWVHGCCGCCAR